MKKQRTGRLEGEFRRLIYEILTTDIKDPEITSMFGVQSVEVDGELKHAKVYVSVFSGSDSEKAATFNAICRASQEVRRLLGVKMHIRAVPELKFVKDNSYEYGEKIDKLLAGLSVGDGDDGK